MKLCANILFFQPHSSFFFILLVFSRATIPDPSMNPFSRLLWLYTWVRDYTHALPSSSPQQRTDTHTHTCRKYWFKQHYAKYVDCKCPMDNIRWCWWWKSKKNKLFYVCKKNQMEANIVVERSTFRQLEHSLLTRKLFSLIESLV